MTITESRLKTGTLTIGDDTGGTTTFSCQATNVRVTPSYDDDGDAIETLCGDSVPAGKRESWVLAGTSVQDFDDPDGFLAFCYLNAMDTVAFEWQPNPEAPTWAGSCVVVAVEEGGDVNTRLTTDWEFDVVGRPTRTPKAEAPDPATGATAGTPGTWTPAGSTPPADAASAGAVVANPASAWTTGQYVQGSTAGSSGEMFYDGSAWVAGRAV